MSTADTFSASTPSQRITALLDAGSVGAGGPEAHGSLCAADGSIAGHAVSVIATDRRVAGGSFGVTEAQALVRLLDHAHVAQRAVVLCLDSAGAKLDEGLAALGAFRHLYRHLLDLRLDGLALLGLIGRDCFGGASMVAAACARRVYNAGSRLAMSGPAVIQALGGTKELDASDAAAVAALMGGTARAALVPADRLCEDAPGAFRDAAADWLAGSATGARLNLPEQHNRLGQRLMAHGMLPSPAESVADDFHQRLRDIVPEGITFQRVDGVLVGRARHSSPNAFFGFVDGVPVGALAAWTLAGECLALAEDRPGEALTVFLDSPGQAPTQRDERVMLSEYVAHLALVLSWLRERGHRVTLQVLGDAAGGIYVALAAPAARVIALPGANVQVLPPAAIARVLRRREEASAVEDCLRAGVIDTLI